ncbi:hypothetical protein VP01_999g5 [Puccinia sorghi]|uniref:Uncharacterized protein n=1 Tax=Puccinia sorghi TaxID=27349 RepID=A0A0L6U579_9BASI|nr:hypothetical protein VP01_999g5 [Puccinia sorghi]
MAALPQKIILAFLVVLGALSMNVAASPAMPTTVKSIMRRAYPDAKPITIIKRSPHANGKPF